MERLEIELPDPLWARMRAEAGADWAAIAIRAFESHLARSRTPESWMPSPSAIERLRDSKSRHDEAQKSESYGHGYAWARDRARFSDLRAMVEAPTYRSAADVVRGTAGFSQRDEFGDSLHPSDEMWEAFVDGATQLYRDVADRL